MTFTTKEQAEQALMLDGTSPSGRRLVIARSKIPLKHDHASSDSGRPAGHSKSGQDAGSAVGNNFEEMQEEQFRRWIQPHYDRRVSRKVL